MVSKTDFAYTDDPKDEANTKTAEAMEYNLRWFYNLVFHS